MNVLEPWVLIRLLLSALVVALFLRASVTCVRVLRSSAAFAATEGQLLLERNMMLTTLLVRVAIAAQGIALVLSFLLANQLYPQIEGAMCGYGVVSATAYGAASLGASVVAAVAAGTVGQALAYESQVADLRFMRRVAWAVLCLVPIVVTDAALCALHLSSLDLSIVTTCCSLEVGDSVRTTFGADALSKSLVWAAPVVLASVVCSALYTAKQPSRKRAVALGGAALVALPLLALFVMQVTAPHVFEVPHHRCPFCLFRADAWFIGYPLLVLSVMGTIRVLGAAAASWLGDDAAWPAFVQQRMQHGAILLGLALALGVLPVLRYVVLTHGHTL